MACPQRYVACTNFGRIANNVVLDFQHLSIGTRVAALDRMTIVPMLLAALLVVGVALFGIIMSGRNAAYSPIPRSFDANADVVIGVPQLADPPPRPHQLASGSMTRLPQTPAGARLRLPGLTRTPPVPVLGPVMHRPLRRLPSNAFSDES
jgi:hypothetical protein